MLIINTTTSELPDSITQHADIVNLVRYGVLAKNLKGIGLATSGTNRIVVRIEPKQSGLDWEGFTVDYFNPSIEDLRALRSLCVAWFTHLEDQIAFSDEIARRKAKEAEEAERAKHEAWVESERARKQAKLDAWVEEAKANSNMSKSDVDIKASRPKTSNAVQPFSLVELLDLIAPKRPR